MDQRSDLLPRRLIFANPERTIVRISHDGTRIAFLAPVDGVLNLWVGHKAVKAVIVDQVRGQNPHGLKTEPAAVHRRIEEEIEAGKTDYRLLF